MSTLWGLRSAQVSLNRQSRFKVSAIDGGGLIHPLLGADGDTTRLFSPVRMPTLLPSDDHHDSCTSMLGPKPRLLVKPTGERRRGVSCG